MRGIGITWFGLVVFIAALVIFSKIIKAMVGVKHTGAMRPNAPKHRPCPACGFLNRPAARYCAQCGQAVTGDL